MIIKITKASKLPAMSEKLAPLRMTSVKADAAYFIGNKLANHCAQSAIACKSIKTEKKICGTTTSGINCIIWNSDCANVDMKIPNAKATNANKRVVKITKKIEPAT